MLLCVCVCVCASLVLTVSASNKPYTSFSTISSSICGCYNVHASTGIYNLLMRKYVIRTLGQIICTCIVIMIFPDPGLHSKARVCMVMIAMMICTQQS